MSSYQCVFDTPQNYLQTDDYFLQGCTPGLLNFLLEYLQKKEEQLTEVFISTPAYNNIPLHQELQKLADGGVRINLVTRPIDSFANDQPRLVIDLVGNKPAFDVARNAYRVAREVFGDLYKHPKENFDFRVFPHLAIHDHEGNPFLQGHQPYSLHLTAILLIYKQGGGAVLFSSSDLSVGKPLQEGHLILAEEDWKLLQNSRRFFQELMNHSVRLQDFDFHKRYSDYPIPTLAIDQHLPVFFLAPFYHDSPSQAEEELVTRIREAKEKIYILSPDINCYEYEVDGHFHSTLEDELIEHYGFLRVVLERAAAGVAVKFLCKNWPGEDRHFQEFQRIAKATQNNQFARNPEIASTFMVVDDQVILSSSSFQPDAFVYLDQVRIQGFTEAEQEGYSGIFSTTSFFWLIEDSTCVKAYDQYFGKLWNAASHV